MDKRWDVIVIGGGIIGLSCAYYLTQGGKSVLLLEKGDIGEGASTSCDDMIFLQSKKPGIMLTIAMESLNMYKQLAMDLPIDLEFENRGGMVLIESESQLGHMQNFVQQQKALGLEVDLLDKNEARKLSPMISKHVLASTYSPMDSQVNPLLVMRGFIKVAVAKGLTILQHTPVTKLNSPKPGHWQVTTADGTIYESDYVVNAAGAWSPQIAELTGINLPIRPKRGQIAVTEAVPPFGKTNFWSADYIVMKLNPEFAKERDPLLNEIGIGLSMSQSKSGTYFLGGTREFVGFDKSVDRTALRLILKEAARFFPALEHVHIIRTFSGFRPAPGDGKPYIGPVASQPGLYIAAGHEGDGIALAPYTGYAIAQMISSKKLAHDLSELSPARLGI
jgi:glycine/D-amino acid oxidase-like deaminating enzyme